MIVCGHMKGGWMFVGTTAGGGRVGDRLDGVRSIGMAVKNERRVECVGGRVMDWMSERTSHTRAN